MSIDVVVTAADAVLSARVTVPRRPVGLVLVPAGGGTRSSRVPSPSLGNAVETALVQRGFAVLRTDCCATAPDGAEGIPLVADRLVAMTRWARSSRPTAGLPIGCFATSTVAAAALLVAAEPDSAVSAVVSSGGRPDLVRSCAPSVTAATLLIVGGADPVALDHNGSVEPLLRCPRGLEVIGGAGNRFAEPGALDQVVELAVGWFRRYVLPPVPLCLPADPIVPVMSEKR